MKIMIVDDSMVIRNKITQMLKNQDFEIVATAQNGLEALEQYKQFKPDVMTLDITMPLMDGIETIQAIMDVDDSVRILVISALVDKATLINAMKLGAYGFLCKPFSDTDLADALEELVEDLN
ncbi:MAG: response regulator [Gammaproteobacteria bacterium]|nr:response regulator [Gammaproteobacteria bacterium]